MKVIIYQHPGQNGWFIKLVSRTGVSAGNTSYATKKEAIAVAQRLHPNTEIAIEE
jgi:hypothetical protein